MSDLIEVKTADLSGEALGWAVGKAEGIDVFLAPPQYGNSWRVFARYRGQAIEHTKRFNPWEDWALGGPLIDRINPEERRLPKVLGGGRFAEVWIDLGDGDARVGFGRGDTRLIAATRAYAAAKLGDTVQVPKELMP
ncbi:phage protein NinX family protein [Pseudomonas sp. NPDC089758]|uniref:phage protein NinX family protein n=1 Tax=Pseudomonas sp. NPDC089758 TaxID=3364473 RepID=UPI0038008B7F